MGDPLLLPAGAGDPAFPFVASIDVAAMPTGATFEEHPRGPLRAAIDVSLPCRGAPVAGRPPAARASPI
ncbi:hypothetical protein C8D87_10818 [Lentzea atacamensis]|uniref:Uncharacterized protein n=1 Tax=Lentzea atacamensis TaxID=531938 RepID=A0ABX9E0Z6_9PSEU|nr:hypothetical protein [Lentzea atacamensis]RAS62199.1 hypothetical protein C8D87_10818 [Lentzea atacamensis]